MTETGELIKRAKRGERIFRMAEGCLILVALVVLVSLTLTTSQTNSQLKSQLQQYQAQARQQSDDTQRVITEIKRQSDTQTAYIRCIALFFAQPNRASATLADLDNCKIDAGGNLSGADLRDIDVPNSAISSATTPNTPQLAITQPVATGKNTGNSGQTTPPPGSQAPAPPASPAPTPRPSLLQAVGNTIGDIVGLVIR